MHFEKRNECLVQKVFHFQNKNMFLFKRFVFKICFFFKCFFFKRCFFFERCFCFKRYFFFTRCFLFKMFFKKSPPQDFIKGALAKPLGIGRYHEIFNFVFPQFKMKVQKLHLKPETIWVRIVLRSARYCRVNRKNGVTMGSNPFLSCILQYDF